MQACNGYYSTVQSGVLEKVRSTCHVEMILLRETRLLSPVLARIGEGLLVPTN